MSNRSRGRKQSAMMAFCGLSAALSVVLMFSGGLIPVATYCVPMVCGILLLPILIEYGKKMAWTTFAAVALITLLIGIDKEAAFFYLFLGYYPILKWEIERIKNKPARFAVKLAVFNISIALMYMILGILLNMDALIEEFTQMGWMLLAAFIVLLNVCMLLYDRLLVPMVFLYANRIRPKLRFLRG